MRRALFALICSFVVTVCATSARGQSATEQLIYSFCEQSGCTDGAEPISGMALLSNGSFVVASDGAGDIQGAGSIIMLTPTGQGNDYSANILAEFCDSSPSACPAGSFPTGTPIEALNGNLYFSNAYGGLTTHNANGSGIIWQYTPPYSPSSQQEQFFLFCSDGCAAGDLPETGLIQGTDGELYGTTADSGSKGYGTVFKIDPTDNITVLHNFCSAENCDDGAEAESPLLQAADGNFYGTTHVAGGHEAGIVFELTPTGNYTVLHTFCSGGTGCPDGEQPVGSLVQADNGNIYGVTRSGGNSSNGGVVFYIDTTGTFHTYVDFGCILRGIPCVDGYNPAGGLIFGSDGNLYGTTTVTSTKLGGQPYGAAFKLPLNLTNTSATNIFYYCSAGSPCLTGNNPSGELVVGSDSNLYGVLYDGGTNSQGAAYFLTTSSWLQPAVQLSLSSSSVAANSPVTLSWTVPYAYSKTAQLCGAFVQNSPAGAGIWTGLQTGSYANHAYSGSSVITPTAEGTYTYALTCGGKESGFATLAVTAPAKTNTATAIAASPNPAIVGQTVTLKATVTGSGATPTGSVSFSFNGSSLGSVSLNGSGVATTTMSTTGLAPGKYSAIATYAGNSSYNSSVSPTITVTVNKASSTTALSVSPASPSIGQSATLKATVTGSSGTPTGAVTFSADGVTLGSASLNGSGVANLTASTNGLPPGTYTVTASYSGNSSYNSSASPTLNVKLIKAPTTTTLSVTPNPLTPPADVTLSATVARSASGATGTATGSVSFSVGTDVLAIIGLNAKGVASLTVPSKGYPAGSYPLKASYSGDSGDSASTSSVVTVTVK